MKLKSYWDVNLTGKFTDNNSSTLCIILPGIAYYLERPYLNYSKQLEYKNIINIYISPIDKTVDFGIKENSLVITGSKDSLLSLDSRNKIKEINNTELINIEGAGHSLDIHEDVFRGIDELKKVIEAERNFLTNRGL